MAITDFSAFLAEEISKVKGIAYPVKAGFLRRVFIRRAACSKLHPNPNDEFCSREIGPNYEIMSRYMSEYRRVLTGSLDPVFINTAARRSCEADWGGSDEKNSEGSSLGERILVERIHPDGYMILNGHHRWGAACRIGLDTLPIRIVDLTQESDFRKMLASSASERRVSLDLDEVIFRPADDPYLEKPLRFPLNRIYRERLRLGIPALFHMLNSDNYDIWVYTAGYYSLDYLRYCFKHYSIRVTGIVTGMARKAPSGTDTRKEMEALLNSKYKTAVHIDNDTVIRTDPASASFDEYRLSGDGSAWSREVMKIFEDWKKKGR